MSLRAKAQRDPAVKKKLAAMANVFRMLARRANRKKIDEAARLD
jgi:hypothetical protein